MKTLVGALGLAGLLAGGGGAAFALPAELRGLVSSERPAGCSEYSYLLWDLYRAELWSDARQLPGSRYALSLTYLSEFSRDALVESSVDEMVRMSGQPEAAFAVARTEMARAFRDVVPGDRITAWREGHDRLRLFVNGAETGAITTDVDLFLAIWLGPQSRDPEGRTALLSGRCNG